jgi:hypothetical protein
VLDGVVHGLDEREFDAGEGIGGDALETGPGQHAIDGRVDVGEAGLEGEDQRLFEVVLDAGRRKNSLTREARTVRSASGRAAW